MAWRCGSASRSFISAARSSTFRSSPSLRPSPQTFYGPSLNSRRLLSTTLPKNTGMLGCVQSLLPLYSAVAASCMTSHISVDVRCCCDLSQGVRHARWAVKRSEQAKV